MSVLEWEANPQPVAAVCATDDVVMTIDGSATLRAFDADGGALGVVTMEATAVEAAEPCTPAWTGISLCGGDDSIIVLCDASNARICIFVCTDQMLVEPLHEVADLRPINPADGSAWLKSPRGIAVDEARGVIVVADADRKAALAIVLAKPLADLLRSGGTKESVDAVTTALHSCSHPCVVACELVGTGKPQAVAALAVALPGLPDTGPNPDSQPTSTAAYRLLVTVADTGSHAVHVYGVASGAVGKAIAFLADSAAGIPPRAEKMEPHWTLGGPGRGDGQLVHPLGVLLWHPAAFDEPDGADDSGDGRAKAAAQRRRRAALGTNPLPHLEDVALVVSDAGNGRLQAWPLSGERSAGVLWIIEYTGQGEEEKLSRPSCVCLSGDGEALVVDERQGVWVVLPDDITGDLPPGSAGRAMIYEDATIPEAGNALAGTAAAGEASATTARSSESPGAAMRTGGSADTRGSSAGGFGATAQSGWPHGDSPSSGTATSSPGAGARGGGMPAEPLVHHPGAVAESGPAPLESHRAEEEGTREGGVAGVPGGSGAWDAALDASSSDDSFLREARVTVARNRERSEEGSAEAKEREQGDGNHDDDDVSTDVASLLGGRGHAGADGGAEHDEEDEDVRMAQTRSPALRNRTTRRHGTSQVPGGFDGTVGPDESGPHALPGTRWSAARPEARGDLGGGETGPDAEKMFHGAPAELETSGRSRRSEEERRTRLGMRPSNDSYAAPAWRPRRDDEYHPPEGWRARQLQVHPAGRGPELARARLRKQRRLRRAQQPRMRRGAERAARDAPTTASSVSLGSTAVLPQHPPPSMLPANLRQDDSDVKDAGRSLLREMLELEHAEAKQRRRLRQAIARNEGKVAELAELAPALAVVGRKPAPTPGSALSLASAASHHQPSDALALPAMPRWRTEEDVPAVPAYSGDGACWEEAALRARMIELSAALKLAERDKAEWERVYGAPLGHIKHLEELLSQVEAVGASGQVLGGHAGEPEAVTLAEMATALREADERCEVAQIRLGEAEESAEAMQSAWDVERRRLQQAADRSRDAAEGSKRSVEAVEVEAQAAERHARLLEEEAAELAERGQVDGSPGDSAADEGLGRRRDALETVLEEEMEGDTASL